MTKARILANLISDNAELADGQISVAEVVGAAPLASPTFTGTASGTFSGPLTGNVVGNLTGDVTGDVTGALTGDVTAPEIDLTAISSTIADTAVDVFVYDTSKDSDGGAWRKRTQHTSWYNEAASSTRGSRKEFPAVAVIVAENATVTIYDGDDPDLPMWMVLYTSAGGTKSVSALNGRMYIARSSGGDRDYNFVRDTARSWYSTSTYNGFWTGGIAERTTTGSTGTLITSTDTIVNYAVNDVAMTVLPNAPIDAATGLPVPTIAVATDGGLSVIRDDGTVANPSGQTGYENVDIAGSRCWFSVSGTSSSPVRFIDLETFQNGDSIPFSYTWPSLSETPHAFSNYTRSHTTVLPDGVAVKDDQNLLLQVFSGPETGYTSGNLTRLLTSTYNTGWMNGDIKLATLSDTDDTDVTGSELVTNGSMEANNSWEAVGTPTASGQTSAQAHSGTYSWYFTGNGNYDGIQSSVDFSITSGKAYVVDAWVYPVNDTGITLKLGGVNRTVTGLTQGAWNQVTETIVSTQTTTAGTIGFNTDITWGGGTWYIDDVSVRLAEEDRSVNGNGLQVFGTVTKNPVATGADLVAYSGFSASNYLQQPYNADLDFGTGNFTYAVWFYINSDTTHGNFIFSRRQDSGGNGFALYVGGAGDHTIRFQTSDGTTSTKTSTQTVKSGQWNLIVASRINATNLQISVNGQQPEYLDTESRNVNVANGTPLHVGINYNLSATSNVEGSIALARISTTVPSPEQIAKIYEDEKVLFQEGAQATLYGSSDAVTALAYDDTTELLHAGTSAGRSVFQGLRRVDNTTDAVGAAISASNGLVAED